MKVKELVRHLLTLNPELPVVHWQWGAGGDDLWLEFTEASDFAVVDDAKVSDTHGDVTCARALCLP